MLRFTDVTGLAGSAAVIAAIALAIPWRGRPSPARDALLLAVAIAAAATPFGALSASGALRGVTGDFSITTLILVLRALGAPLFGWRAIGHRDRRALLVFVAAGGLFLYPLALGIGSFDPYRLGYANPWLMGALLVVALTTWLGRLHLTTFCVALAVLAYSVG